MDTEYEGQALKAHIQTHCFKCLNSEILTMCYHLLDTCWLMSSSRVLLSSNESPSPPSPNPPYQPLGWSYRYMNMVLAFLINSPVSLHCQWCTYYLNVIDELIFENLLVPSLNGPCESFDVCIILIRKLKVKSMEITSFNGLDC